MISKNLIVTICLFVSHSILPMEAGFVPNEELKSALKSCSFNKIKKILITIPDFTQKECDYYQYILSSYGSVYGVKPEGRTVEQLFYPFLFGTPVLAFLTFILGASSAELRQAIKRLSKLSIDDPKFSTSRLYGLRALYYPCLLLTGASALTTIAIPATFTFHAYYLSLKHDISMLLGKHKRT